MKVSVIMSVLNIDEYLFKSIDSIINQTIDKKELIICIPRLFDEYSIQLVKNYIKSNKFINIIEGIDSNLNKLRNKAIDIVKGEYVIFTSSIEELTPNSLEKLYKEAYLNNLDILLTDFISVNNRIIDYQGDINNIYEVKSISRFLKSKIISGKEYISLCINKNISIDNLSVYFFNKNTVYDNEVSFDSELEYDSFLFILNLLKISKYVKYNNYLSFKRYNLFESDLLNRYYNLCLDINMLKKTIDIFRKENLEIYTIYMRYVFEYLYSAIELCCDQKNKEELHEVRMFISNLYKELYSELSLERKSDLEILNNIPSLFRQRNILINEKFRVNYYNNIRNLTLLSRKLDESNDVYSVIIDIFNIINSNKLFSKYASFDYLIDYINLYLDNNVLYLDDIQFYVKKLLLDLEIDSDDDLLKYIYMQERFNVLLRND